MQSSLRPFRGHWWVACHTSRRASIVGLSTSSCGYSTNPSTKDRYRSSAWFGDGSTEHETRDGFIYRSWMRNQGYPTHVFDGRPVIGICNTWSELTPCNAHFRKIAEHVKRGVWEKGGFPLEFPVTSLGETLMRPTAMLYRNLASMDVEESIRANPLDGVVLLTGCDKTTPSLLMGALSVDLPSIVVPGGAMLNGRFREKVIGSGVAVWDYSEKLRSGKITKVEFMEAEGCMSRSAGHCMVMGTASTMTSMSEVLGLALPGTATIPAVEMVEEDLRPSRVLSRLALENAVRVNGAIGGSTNAVIHLLAISGRLADRSARITLEDWDRLGAEVPCILNLQPSGDYLMEDFYYAGGLPAVMRELMEAGLLHSEALTVTGKTVGENVGDSKVSACGDALLCAYFGGEASATSMGSLRHFWEVWDRRVIKSVQEPLKPHGGIIVLKGNLAPRGAVLKPSAASPHLMTSRGRAVVFESVEDLRTRTDDPGLEWNERSVMVLKNCGPRGYPGMAEVGNMPLPKALLRQGVTDVLRISDARMSGTAYGTVVLHASPEAAVGGPLALVRDGDEIELDAPSRRLHLHVSDEELEQRRKEWRTPEPVPAGSQNRGYTALYVKHVTQADQGADLDFLQGNSGDYVPRESH